MRNLITFGLFSLLCCNEALGREQSVLVRITGYWRAEGCGEVAAWNGAHLRPGNCAVDPRRIPYGSKIVFPDAECLAVDTGPAVVSRASARFCGRTAAEKNALVIDRFFETRREAVAWTQAHPQFITVRVVTPDRQSSSLSANVKPAALKSSQAELRNRDGDKLPAPRNQTSKT